MDWKDTLEEILAERRRELGEPPSSDDWIALRAGELTAEERERLLERAAADPEAARELFEVLRFPEPGGDEDPSADEAGVGERWQAFRERLTEEGLTEEDRPVRSGRGRPAWRWLPLAAMFVLGVVATWTVERLRDAPPGAARLARLNLPIVELLPVSAAAGPRGSAERVTLAADAGGLVLALAVPDLPAASGGYRLELTRPDGRVSTFDGLRPGVAGVFVLDLPRSAWGEGLHALRLLTAEGEPVAAFEVEVELAE